MIDRLIEQNIYIKYKNDILNTRRGTTNLGVPNWFSSKWFNCRQQINSIQNSFYQNQHETTIIFDIEKAVMWRVGVLYHLNTWRYEEPSLTGKQWFE